IWEAASGKEVHTLQGHTKRGDSLSWMVVFSRDGQRLGSATFNPPDSPGEVKIWETATGREVCGLQGRVGLVMALAFSPDGRQLVTASVESLRGNTPSTQAEVQFWDVATGQCVRKFPISSAGMPMNAAFSPDGGRLAWAVRQAPNVVDKRVSVWDVDT